MISISHKIELKPNNKQKTYFRKAFGCARFAYNWGLAEWQRKYKKGEKVSIYDLRKTFNSIKKEQFPFVTEVTKFAVERPFFHLNAAFTKFFSDLKKGIVFYPQFKKKRDNFGSFYIGGDQVVLSDKNRNSKAFEKIAHNISYKKQYIKIPNLGWVKMTERVRYIGKINNVVISQNGDKFYVSFSMEITEKEYKRTHLYASKIKSRSVGIDFGIKSTLILSDGIEVLNPKPLRRSQNRIKRLSRQLCKRSHAKTKQERQQGVEKSNNYKKLALKLCNVHRRVANIRYDFIQKVTTILTTNYAHVAIENLNTKGMMRNHHLAQAISDVSFYEIKRQIEYKSSYNEVLVTKADRFYPSSKTCSVCGNIKSELKLNDRIYHCSKCGAVMDRDYNASLNLLSLVTNKSVGMGYPELTPVDLAALFLCFERNGVATSKVETGIQHKSLIL